jgi:hypothetical protein
LKTTSPLDEKILVLFHYGITKGTVLLGEERVTSPLTTEILNNCLKGKIMTNLFIACFVIGKRPSLVALTFALSMTETKLNFF